MGRHYPAFQAYLSSPDTQSAPQWQIDTLATMTFGGHEPTVELYTELRRALDFVLEADDSTGDRASPRARSRRPPAP